MTLKKSEQIEFDNKVIPFYNIVNKQYICKKCNLRIKSRLIQHYERCIGLGSLDSKNSFNKDVHSIWCDLGCGEKSNFFYNNGKAYCSKMGNNCKAKKDLDSQKKKETSTFINSEYKGLKKGAPSWNKGLTKETSKSLAIKGQKYKEYIKLNGNPRKNFSHTKESKEKLRQAINTRYASGWQSTSCGRAKSYPHSSPIAGDMKVTGTWELAFAQILDKVGIKWSKNKKRFPYIKPDGKKSTYLPDFYIDELDIYCEVKGYETDIDREKFKQFPEKLVIIRKSEMKQIKEWLADPLVVVSKENLLELIKHE